MAYDFLGLVNDVNHKMNEVPLTDTNFDDAAGFYSDAKDSVNYAIFTINTQAWEWPHNHVTKTLVLTPDQVRYDFEANTKTINWHTFRIAGSDALNIETKLLWTMDYEDYLAESSDMEYRPTKHHGVPECVFRTPEPKFGIIPPPDRAYTLVYEYYQSPLPLTEWDDVPTIPQFGRYVINDGSYAQAFRFRGDLEMAADYQVRFERGIEQMRSIFINRTDYITSTTRRR